MSRYPALVLCLFCAGALFLAPMACEKKYDLQPLPVPTATATPAATPTCAPIPQMSGPCSSGICLEAAVAEGSNYGGTPYYYGEIYLAVNGSPESTAAVTLTGTGLSPMPLAYLGTQNISGTVYANYESAQPPGLLPLGGTYRITAVTSIGTVATPLLEMPSLASLDPGGAAATWSGPAQADWVAVLHNSGSFSYSSGLCQNRALSSPFLVPASAYPTSDNYIFGVERINFSTALTGGSGVYYVYNLDQIYVSK